MALIYKAENIGHFEELRSDKTVLNQIYDSNLNYRTRPNRHTKQDSQFYVMTQPRERGILGIVIIS